ncbi:Alpha-L-fucosidase [Novipirellula aureliae]|uniref:alpha-L-fucosidase n=1 Tax=Novipirellula aureliae TaxID=2527966 RepID=A0A5C6E6G0_9BACT|nr:alpha-L-fucosidase [Novipirellula aureliae]TWU44380.1 Alpha-L-fucosidase [Novipirellula aureliae]
MKFGKLSVFVVAALLASTRVVGAQTAEEQLEWFRDAKFGMFVHFQAHRDVNEFNPVDFDANQWLQVAKDGGVKYIVITTKHHAGFCIFDSALTEYDVMDAAPFKRDIVGELSEACQANDIRLGCYYSIADYNHPLYDPKYQNRAPLRNAIVPDADISQYMIYMYEQIEELCVKYDPFLFWFDGGSGFRPPERKRMLGQQDMVDLLHSYGAISNSRLGDDDSLRYVDYMSMGDNQTPPVNIGQTFESAICMNNGWGYSANADEYKSVEDLLERLVKIVGKGGNFLLNVAPNSQGVFHEAAIARFKGMGDWLAINGEAIYGTEAGPYPFGLNWGSMTQRKDGKNTILYLNVVDWPADGSFELDGLNNKIVSATLLDGGAALTYTSTFDPAAGLRRHKINVPQTAPDACVSVIALTVEGEASMEQVHMQQNDGSVVLDAYTGIIHDTEFMANKPRRAMDFKEFTVPLGGQGIVPARMLSVAGLRTPGQALSWDFRLVEPGTYQVVVASIGPSKGCRLRATVDGQSVVNDLNEFEKRKTIELPTDKIQESIAVLGTVTLSAPGMQTLTLDVAPDSAGPAPQLRSVELLPIAE